MTVDPVVHPSDHPSGATPALKVVPPTASSEPADVSGTVRSAAVFVDWEAQRWMADVLESLGWAVTAPAMFSDGWFRERTTPDRAALQAVSPQSKSYARGTDPATSQQAGARTAAIARHITASSHQGLLLLAYEEVDRAKPGVGLSAAEAMEHAALETNGITGSPWHRVTDLKDFGLIAHRIDGTGKRVTRQNVSGSQAEVLILTRRGRHAAQLLRTLFEAGDMSTPVPLFEDAGEQLTLIPAPAAAGQGSGVPAGPSVGAGVFTTSADHLAGQGLPDTA